MRSSLMIRLSLPVLTALLAGCGSSAGPGVGTNLFFTAKTQTTPFGGSNTIALSGNYLFAGTDFGLRVFEFVRSNFASSPQVPAVLNVVVPEFHTLVNPGNTSEPIVSLKVNGTVLYEIIGVDRKLLSVVDISTPTDPKLLTQLKIDATGTAFRGIGDIAFSGDVAALALRTDGLGLYDVSNPSDLKLLHTEPIAGVDGAKQLVVVGKTAYVMGGGQLTILDITTPTAVNTLGAFSGDIGIGSGGSAPPIAVDSRGYLYNALGDYESVVDIRNPAAMKAVKVDFKTGTGWSQAIAMGLTGQWLYVAQLDTLRGYDVSDPVHPVAQILIGPTADLTLINDFVATDDGYLFISNEKGISLYGYPPKK